MTRRVNDSIVAARSNGWKKGTHREQPIDGRCPHCEAGLDSHSYEHSSSDHIHGGSRKRKAEELCLSPHDIEYCYYCSEWWSKGESWEQHCLSHLRETVKCYGVWTYGSAITKPSFCPFCWQDDSLKPSQRIQSWVLNQDAARHIRYDHTCPLECRQCSIHLHSLEGIFSHLRDIHDWDLLQTSKRKRETGQLGLPNGMEQNMKPMALHIFEGKSDEQELEGSSNSPWLIQGACASSPRITSPGTATTGTVRASWFEKKNLQDSTAVDTALATSHDPGDMVQHSGSCGDIRVASSVLGMESSIWPADTSAEYPASQAQKSPKPQDRSPYVSEPEETLPPKKRVKLVYKHRLVCTFLA